MPDHPPPPRPQPPPAEMAAAPWEDEFTRRLAQRFENAAFEFRSYLGQNFMVCPADTLVPVVEFLHRDETFDLLVDLTAVDYPKRGNRFELIYILYSFSRNERVRIKTLVADKQPVASLTPVFLAANWLEREVFDMFGITFNGHPNLKRILLPEEWQGHPLRKDSSITGMDKEWVQTHLGIESGQ